MNLTNQPVYPKGVNLRKIRPTDDAFLAWLRKQPSAISGKQPCEACHYRTANNSGMGIKPLYSAIPLTPDEHKEQHRLGQYNFMSKELWEIYVLSHLQKWLRQL